MAVEGSNIHVVWEDWRMVPDRAPEVFYRRSTDNGVTWSEERMLSDDYLHFSGNPQITVESENVFVVWSDGRGSSAFELYYMNSSDNGETWSKNKALTSDDGFNSEWPQIALNDNVIHVAWGDERIGQYEVYYKNSTDGGITWSEDRRLTYFTLGPDGPTEIDVNQSYIHILFGRYMGNYEVFYVKSEDGGLTWTSPVPLSDLDGRNSYGCDLVASGSIVHVGLEDSKSGPFEVYYRNSTDNGTTWHPQMKISNSSIDAGQCDITVSSPIVHIVWYDLKPGNRELYYRNSTDMGASWGEEIRLTYYDGASVQPKIEVSGRYIHLVWLDKRYGDGKIFYKRCPDFGPDTTPPLAPAFLSASLTNMTRDVQLTWSYSFDEGSVGGTARYSVFRSDKMEGPYIPIAQINASALSSYVWIDQGAGEGDSSNYFYRVCALDIDNNTACAENQAGKFTRPLSKGPQLIAVPLIQSNESTETALQTVRYDKAWSYDSSSGKWKWYMGFKPYEGEFLLMNHTLGVWVNVTSDSNLTVAGIVPAETTIHLKRGWNLVGFPSFNSTVSVSDVFLQSGATRIEGFDSTSPPYFLKRMRPEEFMTTSHGYWLYVETDSMWIVYC
ncbi:MAG: exo-alpha-sialidase [Thermoplasmata archaeon]